MTGQREATLQALRLTYNAALAAHQGCMRALIEATMAGTVPTVAIVENEARARHELERVRERLLAAMTDAITGQPASDSAVNEQAAATGAREPPPPSAS